MDGRNRLAQCPRCITQIGTQRNVGRDSVSCAHCQFPDFSVPGPGVRR